MKLFVREKCVHAECGLLTCRISEEFSFKVYVIHNQEDKFVQFEKPGEAKRSPSLVGDLPPFGGKGG